MPEIPDVISNETILISWGNPVRDRSIQRYQDATQRSTLTPVPGQGEASYLISTNALEIWDGANWIPWLSTSQGDGRWLPLSGGTLTGILLTTFSGAGGIKLWPSEHDESAIEWFDSSGSIELAIGYEPSDDAALIETGNGADLLFVTAGDDRLRIPWNDTMVIGGGHGLKVGDETSVTSQPITVARRSGDGEETALTIGISVDPFGIQESGIFRVDDHEGSTAFYLNRAWLTTPVAVAVSNGTLDSSGDYYKSFILNRDAKTAGNVWVSNTQDSIFMDCDRFYIGGVTQVTGSTYWVVSSELTPNDALTDTTYLVSRPSGSTETVKDDVQAHGTPVEVSGLSDLDEADPRRLLAVQMKSWIYSDGAIDASDERHGRRFVGLTAEAIEAVAPFYVDHDADGNPQNEATRWIVPALLSIVQGQERRISALET